jgi:hypothetical protein
MTWPYLIPQMNAFFVTAVSIVIGITATILRFVALRKSGRSFDLGDTFTLMGLLYFLAYSSTFLASACITIYL